MGAHIEGEWNPIKQKFREEPTAASAPDAAAKPANVSKGTILSSKKRCQRHADGWQRRNVGGGRQPRGGRTPSSEEDDNDEADGHHHRRRDDGL